TPYPANLCGVSWAPLLDTCADIFRRDLLVAWMRHSRTTVEADRMETSTEVHELKTTRRSGQRSGYTGATLNPALAAATNDPIALIKTNIARSADARR